MDSLLDEQVAALKALIASAGGMAGIPDDAPEEIKRAFIKMVTDCPDCREQLKRKRS